MITKETLAARFADRLGTGWHTDELAEMVIDAITEDIDSLLMTPPRERGHHRVYAVKPILGVTPEFVNSEPSAIHQIINRAKWIKP